MDRITVTTFFDITATGITGHFKPTRLPCHDATGCAIIDQHSWNHSRNQQRNYETLMQLLSLRTQIFDSTVPVLHNNSWSFEFSVEAPGVFGEDDNFSVLYNDADGVPMLRNLGEHHAVDPVLITLGPRQNIWFAKTALNNTQQES
jgi:hypothetical protein